MPKVRIEMSERVIYSREVEMTEAEWQEWDQRTDQNGRAGDDAVEALRSKYIRPAQDWQDADRLELRDLTLLPDA